MKRFSIYQAALISDVCYLKEVVYWLAFGRPPPQMWSVSGGPWRESDARDSWSAPIPDDEYLEDNECRYAGLPLDPRFGDPDAVTSYLNLDYIRRELEALIQHGADETLLGPLRAELEAAKAQHDIVESWEKILADYLDRFQTEILHDLQTGKLEAVGHSIPTLWLDDPDQCKNEDFWDMKGSKSVRVPQAAWTSRNVDWDDSTLRGVSSSYVWLSLDTEKVLERYPPERVLSSKNSSGLGTIYLATANQFVPSEVSKRGRKAKNWDAFHVEVARRYLQNEMPDKKEAAIQDFIEWFKREHRQDVGRTSIGTKLKPYYDEITKVRKTTG